MECFNRLTVSFDLLLQVEAGDVILKINDIDVVKYSIKEGELRAEKFFLPFWGRNTSIPTWPMKQKTI